MLFVVFAVVMILWAAVLVGRAAFAGSGWLPWIAVLALGPAAFGDIPHEAARLMVNAAFAAGLGAAAGFVAGYIVATVQSWQPVMDAVEALDKRLGHK